MIRRDVALQRNTLHNQIARLYTDKGLSVVPVTPGRKGPPLISQWQERSTASMLSDVEDRAFNIALRCGGDLGLVVIDCDLPGVETHVRGWLEANDISSYLIARTPSGNAHLYLRCLNRPENFDSSASIHSDFAPPDAAHGGEVRFGPRAYVLAPPSMAWSDRVGRNGQYTFPQYEDIEDALVELAEMTSVDWTVIAPLFEGITSKVIEEQPLTPEKPCSVTVSDKSTALVLPVPLPFQSAPQFVYTLLLAINEVKMGEPVPHPTDPDHSYTTRSEAEQAIITVLILCGWPIPMIQDFFWSHQPGHFADGPNDSWRRHYLDTSIRKSVRFILSSKIRQEILVLYHAALQLEWGKSSYLADRIYQLLLIIAWKDRTLEPIAPQKMLAKATGASGASVSEALGLLEGYGLIVRDYENDRKGVMRVRIKDKSQFHAQNPIHRHIGGFGRSSLSLPVGRFLQEVVALSSGRKTIYTSQRVYEALSGESQQIKDLVAITGISRNTIAKRLQELACYGLARDLGRGWILGEADVVALAYEHGYGAVPEAAERAIALQEQAVPEGVKAVAHEVLRRVEEAWLRPLGHVLGMGVDAINMAIANSQLRSSMADLPDGPNSDREPVLTYADTMEKVYGQRPSLEYMKDRHREKLEDLSDILFGLYTSGQIDNPSVTRFIRWAAQVQRRKAREKHWPYLWVDVLASKGMIAWYIDIEQRNRQLRIRAEGAYWARGLR